MVILFVKKFRGVLGDVLDCAPVSGVVVVFINCCHSLNWDLLYG